MSVHQSPSLVGLETHEIDNNTIDVRDQTQHNRPLSSESSSPRQHQWRVVIPEPFRLRSSSFPASQYPNRDCETPSVRYAPNNGLESVQRINYAPNQLLTIASPPPLPPRNGPYTPMASHISQPQSVWNVIGPQSSYTDALLIHQKARLDYIREEAFKLNDYLNLLREEVTNLEKGRISANTSDGVNWKDKVCKLRKDNRDLRIECHCLSMEVDLYASGQAPLGVTDEDNAFYKNIRGGPNGPLTPQQQQRIHPSQLPPSYESATQSTTQSISQSVTPRRPMRSFSNSNSPNILEEVPPAPRHVWIPSNGMGMLQPPAIPPRPANISPRTPPSSGSVSPRMGQSSLSPCINPVNEEEGQEWVCKECTVKNHPALAYCEVCERPRNAYLGSNDRPPY